VEGSNNKRKQQSFDDDLPEGVDFSEGGWATDMAASLLGFLFFISALRNYSDDNKHFVFLHAGTAIAHFFGGLAHRYYPNRATDGVGMRGFYVTMVLGYGGNCLRYSLGWELSHGDGDILGGSGVLWPLLGVVNFCYLVLAASWTVRRMEKTDQRLDDSDATGFLPDMVYAAGELAVAIGEVVASLLFLLERETTDAFALVAVGSNIVGWVAVYAVGGCAFLTGTDYNPNTMQRIFHYSMMIMIWAINEYATSSDDE
jgi:uncharacterized membrane protein YphA (DoxX/SURF4 family)